MNQQPFFRTLAVGISVTISIFATSCNWPTSGSSQVTLSTEYSTKSSTIALGRRATFNITVADPDHGVCATKVTLTQGTLRSDLALTTSLPIPDDKPKLTTYSVHNLDLPILGFKEGTAEINVDVQNCSIFKGQTHDERTVTLDFTPPTVELTSSQHYINQAGAEVATYNVSPDTVWSGITVGPYRFRGYALPDHTPGTPEHFAFFVFSYELPTDTPINVIAIDAAGNSSQARLVPAKFFPKEFRHRDIPIDDEFITTKVGDILAHTPQLKNSGDNLTNFLAVNRDLRKIDNKFLMDLAAQSDEKFYWKDAFRPLANAAVESSFADFRSYYYKQQKVDEQVHLGFDLAVVEHNPILAAQSGKVLFTGYLGIYGNVVVIDHGYGLMTLYAHMSSIDVKSGEVVAMDEKIGLSGATGLAGGDHLHFSMLIQGVQTNPVEFWDQHWIQDHVYLRLGTKSFEQTATKI